MKTAITLIISFITINITLAQGTLTDINTGLTIDYPEGWSYIQEDSTIVIHNKLGQLNIISQKTREPFDPIAFNQALGSDKELIKTMFPGITGEGLLEHGTTYISGERSVYMVLNISQKFNTGTDEILKVKAIMTYYKGYMVNFSAMTIEENYKPFVAEIDDILKAARFPGFTPGVITDSLTGLMINYPDNWQYSNFKGYHALQNDKGFIVIITDKNKYGKSFSEVYEDIDKNYESYKGAIDALFSSGMSSELTGYGKTTVGGKDAVLLDVLLKKISDGSTLPTKTLSIYGSDFIYTFFIIQGLNMNTIESLTDDVLSLLENVVFP
ncbi:MAG: hypothetical protein KDC73_00775 [Ignavibacteriae bacterium]|nr:hypothetical protein [Ignavibacteriota bacterium]MCB9243052.1 hypothetical protein [Ignavibacteriales bacterium]